MQQITSHEIKEFNKQFEVDYKKHNDKFYTLLMMKNLYINIIDYYEDKLGDKSLQKSKNLYLKQNRFDICRDVLSGIILLQIHLKL